MLKIEPDKLYYAKSYLEVASDDLELCKSFLDGIDVPAILAFGYLVSESSADVGKARKSINDIYNWIGKKIADFSNTELENSILTEEISTLIAAGMALFVGFIDAYDNIIDGVVFIGADALSSLLYKNGLISKEEYDKMMESTGAFISIDWAERTEEGFYQTKFGENVEKFSVIKSGDGVDMYLKGVGTGAGYLSIQFLTKGAISNEVASLVGTYGDAAEDIFKKMSEKSIDEQINSARVYGTAMTAYDLAGNYLGSNLKNFSNTSTLFNESNAYITQRGAEAVFNFFAVPVSAIAEATATGDEIKLTSDWINQGMINVFVGETGNLIPGTRPDNDASFGDQSKPSNDASFRETVNKGE